ncbi:MAG: TRAP transporter small permease subunit [Pseudomonadota bacterium]
MRLIYIIDRALARFERWLLTLFLGLMVSLTFLQVILRNLHIRAHFDWANIFMGRLDWTEPLVRLLVLWITFVGASLLTGDNKHIKIDIMSSMFPARIMPYLEILLSAVSVFISAFMVKASVDYVLLEMKYAGAGFLNIPIWVGELILPLGFSTILFRFLIRGIDQGLGLARSHAK